MFAYAGSPGVSCGVFGGVWGCDYPVERLRFVFGYGYLLLFGFVFGWRVYGCYLLLE